MITAGFLPCRCRRTLSLLVGLTLCLTLTQGASVFAAISANVNVDTANVLATMPVTGLGIHTSPYYNTMASANLDERLEEAGVTTLRYGGGGYADVNHWSVTRSGNGITGSGLSPWWGQTGNFGYVGPGSDFATFVRLIDRTDNGRAVVTVNYGSALKLVGSQSQVPDFGGQPKEAAAQVAYANADPSIYGTANDIPLGLDQQGNDWKTAGYWAKLRASTAAEYQTWATADGVFSSLNSFLALDRDAPVGIEYWEIGNETFGTGYYGGGNGYSVNYDVPYNGTNRSGHANLSPAHYGQEVVQYAQLMKSIDPNIKVGAVLSTPPDDWSWDSRAGQHWNPQVLSQPGVAEAVDFVMVHWYPWAGNPLMDEDGDGQADDTNTGASLLTYPPAKIPSMIDGSGSHSGANAGVRDWLSTYGMSDSEIMVTEFRYNNPENIAAAYKPAADALFVADAYSSWLELGVDSVQYLELFSKDFLADDLTRLSAFYGTSMVDKLIEPSEDWIDATSSNNFVRAHAALQDDGSVAVMLLNTHLTEPANVAIDIEGILLGADGTRYTLTSGTVMSAATPTSGLGNLFNATVAPRSIMTFIIPAAPEPVLFGDFNGDNVVDAADYTLWRDNLGDATDDIILNRGDGTAGIDENDYNIWKQYYGSVYSPGAGGLSNSVPEPAALCLGLVGALPVLHRRRRP